MNLSAKMKDIQEFLTQRLANHGPAELGIICGSGLGPIADQIENKTEIPYQEIPHYPSGTVKGHASRLVRGTLEGMEVIAFKGRFHFYEGYQIEDVTLPVRTLQSMEVKKLIVTNAAGGLNRQFHVGDLMAIEDHINFMWVNPLIGPNDEALGLRFPDMSAPYHQESIQKLHNIALEENIPLRKGTYLGVTGPSYETRAELRYFNRIADTIGMSTVPEVIAAKHAGFEKVIGISVVTNMATGEDTHKESHEKVIEAANKATPNMVQLVRSFIRAGA